MTPEVSIMIFGLVVAFLAGVVATCLIYGLRKPPQRSGLEDAEERYRVLTQHLAAAVVIRSLEDQILFCSPFTEVLTGYSQEEIKSFHGDFIESIVSEPDRERYRRSMKVSFEGEPFQFRFRIVHRSGIVIWVESRTVPIIGDNGEPVATLSITLDVTATVRAQALVEEKSREIEDFTRLVSHDLKAPIFTIKGMLSIIQESALPEATREPMEHVTRAVGRLERLVASVLEYSRTISRQHKSAPVELGPVLENLLLDLKPQMERCGAKVSIVNELGTVMADELALTQIFSNLLSNCIKYRSMDRMLEVQVERLPSPGRQAVIIVKDNGRGIPVDNLRDVFRPFSRFHGDEIEGSGVGLACVKKLAERLGGDIEVSSDGSSGSSFKVSLRAPG